MRPLPRAFCLFVSFFDADTAFELYLYAAIADDDLFHQLLEDVAVICVHDVAVFDVLLEGVQPCLNLCIPYRCGFLLFLLSLQLLHPLAVCLYLCCIICRADAVGLLCLMQGEDGFLYRDYFLLNSIHGICVFRLHDQPCALPHR